ncbi:MAG: hypothetical protein KDH88_19045 [Chromatiales bacterium]|nr:hypothetical protein [Chromatiales bacterium]
MKYLNVARKYGARISAATVGASLLFTAQSSHAFIDVTGAVDTITTDGTAAITAVGGALIALAAVAVVFKWVKGSIFS